jgi:peptide/nickel transport system substrate-binding protein
MHEGSGQRGPEPGDPSPRHLTAFLFADIRDYTRFTDRRGAEAASRLLSAFIDLANDAAENHRGRLRGTWGDEVLIEFDSPRDAVRAAIVLQQRCVEATIAEPDLPLLVGVGLDIGEAAESTGGYSGSGLNVASRLCSKAQAGQILASEQLAHSAGAVEGLAYVDRGRYKLKGLASSRKVVLVRPVPVNREEERRFRVAVKRATLRSRARPTRRWVAALTAGAVVAGLGAWGIGRLIEDEQVVIPPGGVAVVDTDSGRLVDAVAVGGAPGGVAAGEAGSIWVTRTGEGTLARIDTDSRRIIPTESIGRAAVAVVTTGRDVWTVNGTERFVRRINAAVNREVEQIDVGNQPVALAAGAGAVWVVSKIDGTVTRIDARSGSVTGTANVGRGPDGVVVSGGTVWVANGRDSTVTPVDAKTLSAAAPIPVGTGPRAIVASGDGLWVVNTLAGTVSHIDTRRREEVTKLPVGESPEAIAVSGGSVWVSASGSGTLVRIDPQQDRVIDTIRLGASPYGIAPADGHLWVATRPFAASRHFGGTLTVSGCCSDWDPAVGAVPSFAYDGIVALRKAGGSDGYDLVPDLAESLPTAPTDSGKAYTFTIRRGIRYSDGRLLRPEDFRRGVARVFTARNEVGDPSGGRDSYLGVVGAQNCFDHPDACDLSAGIETGADTVTFHLEAPDPDFVAKLANFFAPPAPAGSPSTQVSPDHPLPATGPYAIASVTPNREVVYSRNPYFRSWSAAAQPPGYPDRIRVLPTGGPKAVQAVLDGKVDVLDLGNDVPQQLQRELHVNNPDLVHDDPFAFTWMLQPNTHLPPFDNVKARQALAYAVDRGRFLGGFNTGGVPACQVPPSGFPGFGPRCIYTANPDKSGDWHGPDLARAKQLVAESGTKGATVDIWWSDELAEEGQYLASVLRDLGWDPRLRLVDSEHYFGGVQDPKTHKNLTANGWYPNYPASSAYYDLLVHCTKSGYGQYCNPATDRLAASALAAQEGDPGLAERRWRDVFAALDTDTGLIPLIHGRQSWLVSKRVGNYQTNPLFRDLFDQLWVQ